MIDSMRNYLESKMAYLTSLVLGGSASAVEMSQPVDDWSVNGFADVLTIVTISWLIIQMTPRLKDGIVWLAKPKPKLKQWIKTKIFRRGSK